MAPIIFAAFANDADQSLSLEAEEQALSSVFYDQDKLELKISRNVTLDDLAGELTNLDTQQRVIIFHYAGHATAKGLELEDADAYANGLAGILGKLPNLQLVFLNGCDTLEQAEVFINAGIKAVVVTVKPVEDHMATDFAYFFYKAYYNLNTLGNSFEFAKGFLRSKYNSGNLFFIQMANNLAKIDGSGEVPQENIYSLKAINDQEYTKSLLFRIYYEPPNPQGADYEPCKKLIDTIAESILKGNYLDESFLISKDYTSIKNTYDVFAGNKNNNRSLFDLSDAVLTMLPFPISFHLSNLASLAGRAYENTVDNRIELLRLQILTYDSSVQLLCFSMLSCFWRELTDEQKPKMAINPGQWEVIKNFLGSSDINNTKINYPALLITIREIFEKNDRTPFIREYQNLKTIFNDEDAFFTAHLFIQGLRSALETNDIRKLDVNWVCFKTEEILSQIFSSSGFLVRYKLSTVKDIEYCRSRMKKAAYKIKRIILDRVVVRRDDRVEYDNPTDTYSVILARGEEKDKFTDCLSLSPFVFDENAIKGEDLSRLFFYSHAENNCYVYRQAIDPDEIRKVQNDNTYLTLKDKKSDEVKLINQRMSDVKSELDSFKKLINY